MIISGTAKKKISVPIGTPIITHPPFSHHPFMTPKDLSTIQELHKLSFSYRQAVIAIVKRPVVFTSGLNLKKMNRSDFLKCILMSTLSPSVLLIDSDNNKEVEYLVIDGEGKTFTRDEVQKLIDRHEPKRNGRGLKVMNMKINIVYFQEKIELTKGGHYFLENIYLQSVSPKDFWSYDNPVGIAIDPIKYCGKPINNA